MKNRIKILLGAVIGSSLLFSSCNFLDVDSYFQATFKEDSIFHSMKNAEGYLWNTPTRFPDAGAIWGNSWNPGETASDEKPAAGFVVYYVCSSDKMQPDVGKCRQSARYDGS